MKCIKLLIICTMLTGLTSCGVVETFVTHVYDNFPLDNSGNAKEAILNTREAQAWNHSTVTRGAFLASVGMSVVEDFTGESLSVAKGIMDGVVDDLLSDGNNAKSETANLVGAAFYGAGRIAGYVEDVQKDSANARFLRYNQKEIQNDKYFFCRYQMVNGRYTDISKVYGLDSVMNCIRETQYQEERDELRQALEECASVKLEDVEAEEKEEEELRQATFRDEPGAMTKWKQTRQRARDREQMITDAIKCYEEKKSLNNYSEDNRTNYERGTSNSSDIQEISAENIVEDPVKASEKKSPDQITKMSFDVFEINSYKFNSSNLSSDNTKKLNEVLEFMNKNSNKTIEIIGHSCDIGNKSACYNVALQRAKVAKDYLVKSGIESNRINVYSEGDDNPVVPNTSSENRSKNRRIEIIVK